MPLVWWNTNEVALQQVSGIRSDEVMCQASWMGNSAAETDLLRQQQAAHT